VLDIAAGSGLISASLQTRGFTNIDALEIDLHTLNTLQVDTIEAGTSRDSHLRLVLSNILYKSYFKK
jgi:2-polyprenyl-3-methyl-5-hydroxy-6-metoxy-1,4-benzoquinol methylase